MPTFEFADCPTRLDLSKAATAASEQTGTVTCAVRNTLTTRQSGRIRVEPDAGAKPEWFAIAGAPTTSPQELEQDFAPDSVVSITVHLRVPAGVAKGAQTFKLRVTSEQKPDTDFALGPAIGFDVDAPVPAQPKPKVPIWALALVVVLLLAIGGAAAYMLWPNGSLDPRLVAGRSLDDAQRIAAEEGFPDIGNQPANQPEGYDPGMVSGVGAGADGEQVLLTDPGVTIPTGLRGQNVVIVVQTLANIGLLMTPTVAREAGLETNLVASVTPGEGTAVKLGGTIIVAVNEKPAPDGGGTPGDVNICRRFPDVCLLELNQEIFVPSEGRIQMLEPLNP